MLLIPSPTEGHSFNHFHSIELGEVPAEILRDANEGGKGRPRPQIACTSRLILHILANVQKRRRASSTKSTPSISSKKHKTDRESISTSLIAGFCSALNHDYSKLQGHQKVNVGAFLQLYLTPNVVTISSRRVDTAPSEYRAQVIVEKQGPLSPPFPSHLNNDWST